MKISWLWLKEFLPLEEIPLSEAVERLTLIGFEVEQVIKAGKDRVLVLEITPNRPDALSVFGLARELAAAYGRSWRKPKVLPWPRLNKKVLDGFRLIVDDSEDCPVYHGVLIEGVRIGPSPSWLRQRLEAVGLRSINNVVDVTNYVMWETGHPLHAFDAATLQGRCVRVRRAREGENLLTLDEETRNLTQDDIVIADEKQPIALAGIIGGGTTQIQESTTEVFLETAVFDPLRIRRSARRLKIQTESSYRFERRVDPFGVEAAARRAVALIQQTAGGEMKQRLIQKAKQTRRQTAIMVQPQTVADRLGMTVPATRIRKILNNLEFKATPRKTGLHVIVPHFRFDVVGEHDVIEEIARMIGYDTIPEQEAPVRPQEAQEDALFTAEGRWRRCLADRGFYEVITHTMISSQQADAWVTDASQITRLINPLNREQDCMRPSLLPGLLAVLRHNIHHGQRQLRLFELGKVYLNNNETPRVALLLSGLSHADWRRSLKEQQQNKVTFWEIKKSFEALCRLDFLPELSWEKGICSGFDAAQTAVCRVQGQVLAWGGRVDPALLKQWDIDQDVYALEGEAALMLSLAGTKRFVPWSVYPMVARDISCAVTKEIMFEQVKAALMEWGQPLLVEVIFKELYCGPSLPEGRVGWVIGLHYQDAQRTLAEEEVQPLHEQICRRLTEQFGIVLR